MILVTVGTQKFKFDRLFNYIDNITDEEIIVQCGESNHKFNKNVKRFDYIPFDKMQSYISKCDIFICHTTPSCVFDALKQDKKVITVPRQHKYKEHFNDHQMIFGNYLKSMNYCYVVHNEEDFINALKSINKTKFKKYKKPNNSYINIIKKDIDSLL